MVLNSNGPSVIIRLERDTHAHTFRRTRLLFPLMMRKYSARKKNVGINFTFSHLIIQLFGRHMVKMVSVGVCKNYEHGTLHKCCARCFINVNFYARSEQKRYQSEKRARVSRASVTINRQWNKSRLQPEVSVIYIVIIVLCFFFQFTCACANSHLAWISNGKCIFLMRYIMALSFWLNHFVCDWVFTNRSFVRRHIIKRNARSVALLMRLFFRPFLFPDSISAKFNQNAGKKKNKRTDGFFVWFVDFSLSFYFSVFAIGNC